LGEHNELHKFRPSFEKKQKMDGRMGQIYPDLMYLRHAQLTLEMIERGYKHNSLYEQPDVSYLNLNEFKDIKIINNLLDLMKRCPECRKRIIHILVGV